MKTDTYFLTVIFDGVTAAFDYPKDVPMPRIGETIIFSSRATNGHCFTGKVREIRHVFTDGVADIKIKVAHD